MYVVKLALLVYLLQEVMTGKDKVKKKPKVPPLSSSIATFSADVGVILSGPEQRSFEDWYALGHEFLLLMSWLRYRRIVYFGFV